MTYRSIRSHVVLATFMCLAACGSSEPSVDGSDQAQTTRNCLFGEDFFGIHENPDFEVVQQEDWTAKRTFSDLETQQILAALRTSAAPDVQTVAQAFERVDEGVINHVTFKHKPTGKLFVAIEFGAGDNSFGGIFADGSAAFAARIVDGDLEDCAP